MDKTVIRASYESCLCALARLSAYASSKPILITEAHVRQDNMATDDLVNFCIHARRFVENVGAKEVLYKISVETNDCRSALKIGEIIGFILHHNTFEIIRCATKLRMLKAQLNGAKGDQFFKQVMPEMKKTPYSEPIEPLVLFKSDRSEGMRMISLVKFLQIFAQEVLLVVLKENRWLQDNPFQDLEMTEADANRLLSQ